MDTSSQVHYPYCPDHQLDPLGGDVIVCHNALRDVFAQFCHRVRLGGQLEVGHGSGADSSRSRILVHQLVNWQASCL